MSNAEGIIDKSRVELAVKIFARFERKLGRKRAAMNARASSLEAFVQAAQEIGKPAAI